MLTGCLLLTLTNCLDQVPVEIPPGTERPISIRAILIKGAPSKLEVIIDYLFDYTGDSRIPVRIRQIVLEDDRGNLVDVPRDPKTLNTYRQSIPEDRPGLRIETGGLYRLRVETLEDQVFVSSFETIAPLPKPDSVYASMIEKEVLEGDGEYRTRSFFRFYLDTPIRVEDSGEPFYLRWDTERTYRFTDTPTAFRDGKTCYFTEVGETDNFLLVDESNLTGDRLEGFELYDEPVNSLFGEGYYFTVYQQSLSEERFEYWTLVRQVVTRSGSMFDPPVGVLRSNFTNLNDPDDEAFGYFFATAQDTLRL